MAIVHIHTASANATIAVHNSDINIITGGSNLAFTVQIGEATPADGDTAEFNLADGAQYLTITATNGGDVYQPNKGGSENNSWPVNVNTGGPPFKYVYVLAANTWYPVYVWNIQGMNTP